MKVMCVAILMFAMSVASAASTMKMNYTNTDLSAIIEAYSKASGQKFVVDPGVRGKISIYLPEAVTIEEAFNHLSSALAVNGFGISKQGDTMVIKSGRNIQRDYIETSTERPSMKPERMYTWIYTAKNLPVESMNRDLRIIVSKDGEMTVNVGTNQLIITDWVSNLNRVADLFAALDKPVDPAAAKFAAETRKKGDADRKSRASKPPEPKVTN